MAVPDLCRIPLCRQRGAATERKPDADRKSLVPSVAAPDAAAPRAKSAEPKPLPDGSTVAAPPVKPSVEVAKLDSAAHLNRQFHLPMRSPPAEGSAKIGRFMSDGDDVLLKFQANRAGWRRVLPEEFLVGHQPFLALPSYRSRVVVLNVGATLELINGTRSNCCPTTPRASRVDIDFGRVVIKPLAQAGAVCGGCRTAYGHHRVDQRGIDCRAGSDAGSRAGH